MNVTDLSMPLVILILGMLAIALLAVFMLQNLRLREVEHRERRDDKARNEARLLRQEQRERDSEREASFRADTLGGATLSGDYFTIAFNKGPDITAYEFEAAIQAALDIPLDLAQLGAPSVDGSGLQVRVHRARYENPLELIVLVTGAPFLVGTVIAWSRQINAAVQEIRRSMTETSAIQAGHGENEARHDFHSAMYEILTSAIFEEDRSIRDGILERVSKIADVATTHDLMSVTHTEVAALDASGNMIREILPNSNPKELGN